MINDNKPVGNSAQEKYVVLQNQEIKNIIRKLLTFSLHATQEEFNTIKHFFSSNREVSEMIGLAKLSQIYNDIEANIDSLGLEGFKQPENMLKVIQSLDAVEQYIDDYLENKTAQPQAAQPQAAQPQTSYTQDTKGELENNPSISTQKAEPEPEKTLQGQETSKTASTHKVLAVEDSVLISNIIRNRLQALGYQVEAALDGLQAIDKVISFSPNIIILDLMLPKMNGFEVLRKIKEENLCPNAKVVVLSAKNEEQQILQILKLGADDYIAKPFSLDVLDEKIKKLCG